MQKFYTGKFFWQDSIINKEIKNRTNNNDTSYYPVPVLVIIKKDNSYLLCYKVRVSIVSPILDVYDLYINAQSGEVVRKKQISTNCYDNEMSNINTNSSVSFNQTLNQKSGCAHPCNQGTAHMFYYAPQYIYTDKVGNITCTYILKNTCTSTFLYVRDAGNNEYKDNTNLWVDTEDFPGTTALWCIEKTHEFYTSTFGRNSYDNQSSQVNVRVGSLTGNALWTSSSIEIGKEDGDIFSGYLTTLDVMGHEFTHGVIESEANLTYSGEPGAINESICDIFGTMVDFYGKTNYNTGLSPNYVLGEECTYAGKLRDMSNPNCCNQPDTYNGLYWVNPNSSIDNGGVHTNSGVMNFWFYLLSEGGTGINDKGNLYCVHGIGRDKASRIVYYALNYLFGPNTDFLNARYATEIAASNLFGLGPELAEVQAAWYAVGVGAQPNVPFITIANKVDNGIAAYHYNNPVRVIAYTANPGSHVEISSADEVHLESYFYQNPSPPNINHEVHFAPGSEVHVYIAPGCQGGARLTSNEYSQGKNNSVFEPNISLENQNQENAAIKNRKSPCTLIPNPAHTSVTITLAEKNNNTIQKIFLKDLTGKILLQKDSNTSSETIDISHLSNGLYFVMLQTTSGTYTEKLIVRHE